MYSVDLFAFYLSYSAGREYLWKHSPFEDSQHFIFIQSICWLPEEKFNPFSGMNTLAREETLSDMFLSIEVFKWKEFAPESKFPFRVIPITEEAHFIGKLRGIHKNCLLVKTLQKIYHSPLIPSGTFQPCISVF